MPCVESKDQVQFIYIYILLLYLFMFNRTCLSVGDNLEPYLCFSFYEHYDEVISFRRALLFQAN
jgi:hypothetical protein